MLTTCSICTANVLALLLHEHVKKKQQIYYTAEMRNLELRNEGRENMKQVKQPHFSLWQSYNKASTYLQIFTRASGQTLCLFLRRYYWHRKCGFRDQGCERTSPKPSRSWDGTRSFWRHEPLNDNTEIIKTDDST